MQVQGMQVQGHAGTGHAGTRHALFLQLMTRLALIVITGATIIFQFSYQTEMALPMKKIDILNYITDFRKAPNSIKTYAELVSHLGKDNESALNTMLNELKQLRTIRETELNGERAFQVTSK